MKTVAKILSLTLVMMFVVASVSMAQPRGDFFSRGALILCDVLLLNQEKSDKVVAVYSEVSQAVWEEMRNSGADFRNMSAEERTKTMEKNRKDTAEGLKKGLKDVLPEKEIKILIAAAEKRPFLPVPEMRALRSIELKPEQREKLLPLTAKLSESFVGGFRGPRGDGAEREKAQKAFEKATADFIAKAAPILTDDQKTAWKTKAAEVKKENDEMMERMQNMRRQ